MSAPDPATALNPLPRRVVAPVWFFLGGLAAGGYVVGLLVGIFLHDPAGLAHARLGDVAGFALVTLGALLLTAELTKPMRMWRLLTVMKPASPLSVGVWLLTGFAVVTAVASLAAFSVIRVPGIRIIDWIGVAFALGLGSYTGLLLVGSSRPVGSASILPGPIFLTLALASGGALHLLARPWIGSWVATDRIAGATGVLGLGAVLLSLFWADRLRRRLGAAHPRVRLLVRGRLAPMWWGGIFVGGFVPAVLLAPAAVGRGCLAPIPAAACVLVGGLALRYAMYNADLEKR